MSFLDRKHFLEIVSNGIFTGIILLFAIGIYAAYINKAKILDSIIPKSENFTELYFTKYEEIPRGTISDVPFYFHFAIHNLEHKTVNYPISIFVEDTQDSNNKVLIYKTTQLLNSDEEKINEVKIKLPYMASEKEKVVVNLDNKNQQIFFRIVVSSPSATFLGEPK